MRTIQRLTTRNFDRILMLTIAFGGSRFLGKKGPHSVLADATGVRKAKYHLRPRASPPGSLGGDSIAQRARIVGVPQPPKPPRAIRTETA
jgi:hypothetical protein